MSLLKTFNRLLNSPSATVAFGMCWAPFCWGIILGLCCLSAARGDERYYSDGTTQVVFVDQHPRTVYVVKPVAPSVVSTEMQRTEYGIDGEKGV